MDKLTHPHDKYFRASMSDLRVAKSFLQAHLPENILRKINWSSLQLESNHHVDKHLSETMTDILYSVKLKEEQGYISILVEHQSSADPLMPFRVLCYSIDIMQRYLKQHPGKALPLVVPIVFYSGQAPYKHTTDIFTLFDTLEPLAREVFLKPFHLIDVGRIPDEELRKHTWAGVMELVQKHIYDRDFLPIIKVLAPLLKKLDLQKGDDYIYGTLTYISNTANVNDINAFAKTIHQEISPEIGNKFMTLTEMLLKEGREKGRQELVQEMLKEGVDPKIVSKITGIPVKELEVLH